MKTLTYCLFLAFFFGVIKAKSYKKDIVKENDEKQKKSFSEKVEKIQDEVENVYDETAENIGATFISTVLQYADEIAAACKEAMKRMLGVALPQHIVDDSDFENLLQKVKILFNAYSEAKKSQLKDKARAIQKGLSKGGRLSNNLMSIAFSQSDSPSDLLEKTKQECTIIINDALQEIVKGWSDFQQKLKDFGKEVQFFEEGNPEYGIRFDPFMAHMDDEDNPEYGIRFDPFMAYMDDVLHDEALMAPEFLNSVGKEIASKGVEKIMKQYKYIFDRIGEIKKNSEFQPRGV